jgi:site-specific DNA recombinase
VLRTTDVRPDAVAIYIRWSTDEQGEGTTLEVQRERCSLFVRSQGWMVREDLTFVDEGYSGATLDRPGLTRLRQAVADGRVDCVVTYKLDRLSRNLAETMLLVRQEWAGRCIYRSATEGFDTSQDSPTGGLIFNILASFAEFERAVIRDRTVAGTRRRMKEGMYISGTVPFGYERAGKGQLKIKPGEAETVARIFEMALTDLTATPTQIARRLNEEGIPGPSGGKWWASTVTALLRNPLYAGVLVYGRRNLPPTVPGGVGRYDARGEPIAQVEGAVPAIIRPELFAKVHAVLAQRMAGKPRRGNRARDEYLLTTVATCKCGGPLGAVKDRYGNLYYRCQRKHQGVGCTAGSVAFRGKPVEEAIAQALRARFAMGLKEQALQILQERFASDSRRRELEEAIKALERRKQEVLEDLARLRRQARQGKLAASTYEELKADAEAEWGALDARQRDLQGQAARAGKDGSVLAQMELSLQALDEWESLPPAGRKELLRALCEQLTVFYPGQGQEIRVEVTWIG